ncbi:MAG: PD40 domain-containing protein [candidate division Zixibacteria bacterium]|nr:PD40 domain-containing protein [candidate division Zixibacteria bacterium]
MRRIMILLCLLFLIVGGTTTIRAESQETPGTLLFENALLPIPAGPGKVAFFRSDAKIPGNPIELFVGDIKTREETRVLPGYNFRQTPGLVAAWSPDGKEYIIPNKISGSWELVRYQTGSRSGEPLTDMTQHRIEVTPKERDALGITSDMQLCFTELSYSPSGKHVIFTLTRLAKSAIWKLNLETGKVRQVTEDRVGYSPSFHPDDEHFCYAALAIKKGISADEDILFRSVATGEIDTLCNSFAHEYNPVISPDGKYLLYIKRVHNINNVHVMNLTSRESRQLTFAVYGQNCTVAKWNANGKRIFIQGAGYAPELSIYMEEFKPF